LNSLLLIGIIILIGYIAGKGSNTLRFPGVLGYLIAGVLLGSSFSHILKPDFLENANILVDLTLGIVGFVIGNEQRSSFFKETGKSITVIILAESFGAFIVVTFGVYFITKRLDLALLLGAIAPASAPAGTIAVLQEYRAKGPLARVIKAVVGLDDGLGIIIYGFTAAIVKITFFGQGKVSLMKAITTPLLEILGAIGIGFVLGILLGIFSKKIKTKQELLVVSLGSIVVCTGLCNLLHFSLILGNLALGTTLTNLNPTSSDRMSNIIEEITPPLYIIFFVIAGAHLNIRFLPKMGLIGITYIIFRITGLMGGSYLGAASSHAPTKIRKYLGFGILSQAGVAIGLSLLVVREFGILGPEGKEISMIIINTIAATTIIFELIGPITTKYAIFRAGEVEKKGK